MLNFVLSEPFLHLHPWTVPPKPDGMQGVAHLTIAATKYQTAGWVLRSSILWGEPSLAAAGKSKSLDTERVVGRLKAQQKV